MLNRLLSRCGAVAPLLWEYVEGTLPEGGADKARVESHLARCSRCRTEAEAYRRATQALSDYAASPNTVAMAASAPPPRWEAVRSRIATVESFPESETIAPARRRLVFVRPFALAAGVVGAALVGGVTLSSLRQADTISSASDVPITHSVGDPSLSLNAEPSFIQLPTRGIIPLVITVKNNTPRPLTADLAVEPWNSYNFLRRYTQRVEVPAATTRKFFAYPSADGINQFGMRVRLVASSRTLETTVALQPWQSDVAAIGYIGDHLGLLYKARTTPSHNLRLPPVVPPEFMDCYARPEAAPDRSVGYENLNMVVLGRGAERLNPSQWKALQAWVSRGGSLVMLGGSAGKYLKTAQGAELAPVTLLPGSPGSGQLSWTPTNVNDGRHRAHLSEPFEVLRAAPKPGGKIVNVKFDSAGYDEVRSSEPAVFVRRQQGLGTILYVGFDLTQRPLREWSRYDMWWKALCIEARPTITYSALRWKTLVRQAWSGDPDDHDPFSVALPPLDIILSVFLGYFVLAIPVTFVVLKRTQRMNLAWVTGPTLAFLFAGGLYLFSSELRMSPLSRRTTGFLVMSVGEKEAQFTGKSELFFPTAGTYDVTVPEASSVEIDPHPGRTLESFDDGEKVTVPRVSVANMAFRRFYHAQSVPLGQEGLTTDLHLDTEGYLVGVIHNGTGRTFLGAQIVLPGPPGVIADENYRQASGRWFNFAVLGDLKPGTTQVRVHPEQREVKNGLGDMGLLELLQLGRPRLYHTYTQGKQHLRSPILMATTSGADLGPPQGVSVDSDASVTVLATLPPLGTASVPVGRDAQQEKEGARK